MQFEVGVGSAQRDSVFQMAHEVNELWGKEPKPPTIICFPKQGRGHLHAPFCQKDNAQSVSRLVQVSHRIRQDGTEVCPKPLANVELGPPRGDLMVPVGVMRPRNSPALTIG